MPMTDCFGEPLVTHAETPSEIGVVNHSDDDPFVCANTPTYVATEARVPAAYFGGWANIVYAPKLRNGRPTVLLRTKRTGADGVSDARYLVGRIGSGLYWAEVMDLADYCNSLDRGDA